MRAVKNLFAAALFLCAGSALAAGPAPSTPAAPASAPAPGKISLLCTGWLPAYTSWEMPPAPTAVQGAQLMIEIDRAAALLSTTLPVAGEVSARLEVSDRAYGAAAPVGRVLLGRGLDAVEVSVNRFNGQAVMRYMVGETAYPAFTGNCALRPRS